ncbi:MAG: hypothetical protein CFE26_23355, partial [Verrucomicrobiales bacterium VVV1]
MHSFQTLPLKSVKPEPIYGAAPHSDSIFRPMNALSRSLCSYWNSSIGKKLLVALTGLALVLFLAGHLTGNLLVFVGREAFNDYAELLHRLLHGAGVWIARIGLLPMVV